MSTRIIIAMSCALLTTLVFADPTHADPTHADSTPIDDVQMLLGAIDIPLTPETMAKAGLTEARATAALAKKSETRYARMRAIGALSQFATPTAREKIEAVARGDDDVYVQRQAVAALVAGFGQTDTAGVRKLLAEIAPGAPAPVAEEIQRQRAVLNTVALPPAPSADTVRR